MFTRKGMTHVSLVPLDEQEKASERTVLTGVGRYYSTLAKSLHRAPHGSFIANEVIDKPAMSAIGTKQT